MTRTSARAAAALLLLTPLLASAAARPERRGYDTRRVATAPRIDGLLDDDAWGQVEWTGEFVQREPDDGKAPTKQTQFKVVYDDDAIYFGFRAFDDPAQVRSLLSRRDQFPGDWVEVNLDSHGDRRTASSFTLSLSGTRGDEFISRDGDNWDGNWDPIWEGATHVDAEGWTAEMRIPLSQIRFDAETKLPWGLQVQRRIFRQEERSTWQHIPKDSSGWVSQFGELRGVQGLETSRRFELLPYSVARAERFESEPGDPFQDGSMTNLTGGLDGKIGFGSNLTMDFTLNPDFGQVEADPSEVNLTAFETFFAEKRPFFIEGNHILDLRLAPAITGGHFTSDRLFYSRRIGAPPPYSADLADGEYADQPQRSSILGAFKLSGKTAGGLSIGVLEAVTQREEAQIDAFGVRRREAVSPLTNALVARVQQDLRGGDTQIGAMLTSLHRSGLDDQLVSLPGQAWAGGIDFAHYFANRRFLLEGDVLASRLSGSAQAIEEAQTSSARYFQRPDHDHATFDPTRTSLAGHAGGVRLTRTSSQSAFRMQTGVTWRSPGFEVNDLGFMNRGDEINQFGWAAWQIRNPFSIFRRFDWNVNEWVDLDFGGNVLRKAFNTNAWATFRNNWRLGGGVTRQLESLSNTELRGGPASRWPAEWNWEAYLASDSRHRLNVEAGASGREGDQGSGHDRRVWADVRLRPTDALTITLSPSHSRSQPELQYVDTLAAAGDPRYLLGRLDQSTTALTLRVDLSLSPNLTIQFYGAPFVSSGRYQDFARIVDPKATAYRDRFQVYQPGQIALADGSYSVDENRDGQTEFSFDRPDFDVRDFNSTLVARWEYRPGSSVYLVWSQARSDDALLLRELPFRRGVQDLWDAPPHDVFLIKFSKWFSM